MKVVKTPPRLLAAGLQFAECPRWCASGLYFSDMYGHKVHRLDESGAIETVCELSGRAGGLGFLPGGDMLVVSVDDARVLRLGAGGLSEYLDLAGAAAGGLNDMVVGADGKAYIGKMFSAMPPPDEPLLYADEQGHWRELDAFLSVANGMVITGDGRLIVAESAGGRLSVFDLGADGVPRNRKLFAQLPVGHAPDGICYDAGGGVWVACPVGGGFLRIEEGGRVTHSIPLSDSRWAIACALGGSSGNTLFMCTSEPYDPIRMRVTHTSRIEAIEVPYAAAGIL